MTPTSTDDFGEFQKLEYERIAEAHFKTSESISAFFRYYLLIAAVPLSVVAALAGGTDATESAVVTWARSGPLVASVFASVAFVGWLVFLYVIQLRFDALLYARQVNLLRKYFHDRSSLSFPARNLFSELPTRRSFPSYGEFLFLPVVLAFGFINSLYAGLACAIWNGPDGRVIWFLVALLGSFAVLHVCAYWLLAKYREQRYLAGRQILVDIDGVLNQHREHFCDVYNRLNAKTLKPEQITALPVSRTPGLGISKSSEREVFRTLDYWLAMPPLEHAADSLDELRSLGIKVVLVTKRPWPEHRLPRPQWKPIERTWRTDGRRWICPLTYQRKWVHWAQSWDPRRRPIEVLTKAWLAKHGFKYDRLIVEGDTTSSWWRRWFMPSRFAVAQRGRSLYCVDDDPIVAMKMAFSCDLVFLMDHPYNQPSSVDPDLAMQPQFAWDLPPNVIRVSNWHAVYQAIRHFH